MLLDWYIKIEKIVIIRGNKLFDKTGFNCEVDPNASSKFDIKYTINMIIKENTIVFENLSFCFKFLTIEDDKRTNEAIKNGKKIKS